MTGQAPHGQSRPGAARLGRARQGKVQKADVLRQVAALLAAAMTRQTRDKAA